MFIIRALLVWLLIVLAESASGTVRRIFIEPAIGDIHARRVGFLVGMLLIFIVAFVFIRWIGAHGLKGSLLVGLTWMILTACFELSLGLLLGYSADRILEDYDPSRGGLMGFGLLYMVFVPWLAATLHARGNTRAHVA